MKRILACALMLCLLALPWASAEGEQSGSALDVALEAAQKLTKLASMEDYVSLFTPPGEISQMVLGYGGDWAGRQQLVGSKTMHLPKLLFSTALSAYSLSKHGSLELAPYEDHLMQMMAQMPLSLINGRSGSAALAASSIARYSEIRSLPGMMPGVTYVLLDYGQEHPFILVTFIVAGDGAATVNASFLTADHAAVDELLKRYTTLDGLKELLFSR